MIARLQIGLVFFGVLCVAFFGCARRTPSGAVTCSFCATFLSPNATACPKCGEPTQGAGVVTNSVGMKLMAVHEGRFRMGAQDADEKAAADEKPAHDVWISRPFLVGVTEVTQEQFAAVMGFNPSRFSSRGAGGAGPTDAKTETFPVELVSWLEADEFCRRLTEKQAEKAVGRIYRLPTEAEWEYCARGWAHVRPTERVSVSRPLQPAPQGPCMVEESAPSSHGLRGLADNVAEWTADWYSSEYYRVSTGKDPTGMKNGAVKAFRGGAWNSGPDAVRISTRDADVPEAKRDDLGFRVVCLPATSLPEGNDPSDAPVVTSRRRAVTLPGDVSRDVVDKPPPQGVPIAKCKLAVVLLEVITPDGRSQGSGFIIDRSGIIVTNYHVVRRATEVAAVFSDGFREQVNGTVKVIEQKDLAFLKLSSSAARCVPLEIAKSLPRDGERVYALGCPLGLAFSVSEGIVSGFRSSGELREAFRSEGLKGPELNVQWIQTTAAVNWGNSGGPLLNEQGHVVGVNTLVFGRDRDGGKAEGLNFAISATDVLGVLPSAADDSKPFSVEDAPHTGNND